jgi:hypothetical protein
MSKFNLLVAAAAAVVAAVPSTASSAAALARIIERDECITKDDETEDRDEWRRMMLR